VGKRGMRLRSSSWVVTSARRNGTPTTTAFHRRVWSVREDNPHAFHATTFLRTTRTCDILREVPSPGTVARAIRRAAQMLDTRDP
jgi:hypothetical protein